MCPVQTVTHVSGRSRTKYLSCGLVGLVLDPTVLGAGAQ